MSKRPTRIRIVNELGNQQSLPDDPGQFETVPGGPETIFLGLGPAPDKLPELFPDIKNARFIESADMVRQVDQWIDKLPPGLTDIRPEEFTPELAANATIIRYRPGLKAFPNFWGPLTARIAASRMKRPAPSKTVWLPLGENDLLVRELTIAFEAKGYAVRTIDREKLERSPGTELPTLLEQETPELFFSVNFKGLEPFGLGYNLLREAGVQVAIWLVDNPFNLLTSVKSGYWKTAALFITDHSFIGPLIEAGARWVTHLPLAACPELFAKGGTLPKHGQDLESKLVFVGRSEFPKKENFFAGLTPDQELLEQAMTMLEKGERPDFHWWHARIPALPWPGNQVRQVGIGAEVAGYGWRVRCLTEAGPNAIIFGDDKWGQIEDITADVRPLLDYYTTLPAVYRAAAVSLNVTGMQLPAGLTQRHFDVWCAGGFLISDTNPGLAIFPDELREPICFTAPGDIHDLFVRYREESDSKQELRAAWQDVIQREHTYHNRIDAVLAALRL